MKEILLMKSDGLSSERRCVCVWDAAGDDLAACPSYAFRFQSYTWNVVILPLDSTTKSYKGTVLRGTRSRSSEVF